MNPGPCRYGHINNIDAFEMDNLKSEEKQRPGITVKTIIEEAERFKMCPLRSGLTVIEGETTREATIWDVQELKNALEGKDVHT
jgi:hypothetical protein